MARGGGPRSGVLPRHSSHRHRTDRQRCIRRRDGGCIGYRFVQRPRRHRPHRAGPGGSAAAAGALEEEQASGRGRNGRCHRRWRSDRCCSADHQAFHQPHTRGLTAGAGDRGHSQDSDHRLGGATGHPGFAASQHSSAHDGRPAAEHHRRHACHRDDERAAEVRRHGPGHRDSEGNAAHHNGAGQGDAGWQRGRPSLGPSPGNDRARCRRRPRRRHTGSEPSADNVGGRSDGTDARVSDRRVHRLRKEPSPRRQGRYGGSRSCRLLLPPLLLSVLRCDLGQLEVGVAEVVGAGPGCQEADHYAGKALESVSVDRPAPLRSGGT